MELGVLIKRIFRRDGVSGEDAYRRNISGLRASTRPLARDVGPEDIWMAGAPPEVKESRAKKVGATLTAGLVSGGCGGCGCGG